MKINLNNINKEFFYITEHGLNGGQVYLINPKIDAKWDEENLIFRSSLWNSNGEPVSLGLKKFFNWGENVQLSPMPDFMGVNIVEKLDGSLLIVSKYKGKFIFRTRGTIDATLFENGSEINELFKRHSTLLDDTCETWDYSILFEWVSNNRSIIIKHESIDFILIGIVRHGDYSIFTQRELDIYAVKHSLKRPKSYNFNTVEEMINTIQALKGTEGVVVYSCNDQIMHKLKTFWYLALHHLKSQLSSKEKVLDVWFNFGKPSYNIFYERVKKQFDHELAEYCNDSMKDICDKSAVVDGIILEMKKDVCNIKNLSTRKEQAEVILKNYKGNNRTFLAFNMLNNKEIKNEDYKKLMMQVL